MNVLAVFIGLIAGVLAGSSLATAAGR